MPSACSGRQAPASEAGNDIPRTADSAKSLAAASLICDDADSGVLILRQSGVMPGARRTKTLPGPTLAVAALAVRVLLSANRFNVAKTMSVIDQWIENYGRERMAQLAQLAHDE